MPRDQGCMLSRLCRVAHVAHVLLLQQMVRASLHLVLLYRAAVFNSLHEAAAGYVKYVVLNGPSSSCAEEVSSHILCTQDTSVDTLAQWMEDVSREA